MNVARSYISVGLVSLLLSGCGSPTTNTVSPQIVIAVDTSLSAVPQHPQYFAQIKHLMMGAGAQDEVALFRFDAACAEVFREPAPSEEKIGEMLNETLKYRTDTKGTNLAKLLANLGAVVAESGKNSELYVFTDCGTENMTKEDELAVRKVLESPSFSAKLVKLNLVGVKPGHRERMRQLINLPPEKFRIVDQL